MIDKNRYNPTDVSLLLVEDDDVDAMVVQRSLKSLSIKNRLLRAHDGIEALEMLHTHKVPQPFIVLLDMNMPRMNGAEFLKALRADPNFSNAIVFVLTTSQLKSDLNAAYQAHVAGYIVKRSDPEAFAEVARMLASYWHVVELPIHTES